MVLALVFHVTVLIVTLTIYGIIITLTIISIITTLTIISMLLLLFQFRKKHRNTPKARIKLESLGVSAAVAWDRGRGRVSKRLP